MTLHGIDISGWQPDINLRTVPGDFAIVKATGGTGFVSSACNTQMQNAKAAGKLRGIYHFAREAGYRGTAAQEAAHFLKHCRGFFDGETILVLDWEGDNTWDTGWALEWLSIVHKESGIRPLIYMSAAVANAANWQAVANAGYGLWVAAYVLGSQQINGYNPPTGLAPIPYWSTLAMWQYTDSGRLAGWPGNLDLNIFYGDKQAWLKYAAKNGAAKPVTPAPSKPAPVKPTTPKPSKPAPSKPAGTYTVKAGDSLSAIAAKFGTTWQALAAINRLVDPNVIHPGQVLKVSGSAPKPSTGQITGWTVDPGDTLTGISAATGVSVADIQRINGIKDPNLIYPGQKLRIR